MTRCTTIIEWLTYANGHFGCEENFNESAVQKSLKADISPSIFIDVALYDIQQKAALVLFFPWGLPLFQSKIFTNQQIVLYLSSKTCYQLMVTNLHCI